MYTIHGFAFAPNSFKPLLVAEELGVEFEYKFLDPSKNEHKTPEHMQRHFLGKVPTLTHNGKTLFESAAICRFMCANENKFLPTDDEFERATADQWIDCFSQHMGRWMNALYFEKIIGPTFQRPENPQNIEEATKFLTAQLEAFDQHLSDRDYICGSEITLPDLYGYSYLRSCDRVGFSLDAFANVKKWIGAIKDRPATARAEERFNG